MRTTMNTVYAKTIANLNKLTSDMDNINTRLSTGRSLNKISDNPVNMVGALNLRSSVAEISQYEENLQYGNTMITAAGSALVQIKEQVLEAKVIAIEAQNPAVEVNRFSIAPKVENLIAQSVTLANSQINGKYIFGGFRTSGYTEKEPAPFLRDFVDGYRLNGSQPATQTLIPSGWSLPSGEVQDTANLTANALEFYYPSTAVTESVGAVDFTTDPLVNGLNMDGALDLRDQINADTSITASLTTLVAGGAATANPAPNNQIIAFDINGETISFGILLGDSATQVAQRSVDAINLNSAATGVEAELGNGINGGVINAIVLRNLKPGNEGAITITNISAGEGAILNLQDGDSSAADATHNTGQVSLASATDYTFGTTSEADLLLTGLTGGTTITQGWTVQDGVDLLANDLEFSSTTTPPVIVPVGAVDLTNSGSTRYGVNPLNTTNLRDAINLVSPTSGVTAFTTTQTGGNVPATATTTQAIDFDLAGSDGVPHNIVFNVNGTATEVAQQTIEAINTFSSLTGVEAIRGNDGNGGINNSIILRNIQDGDEGGITITNLPAGGLEAGLIGLDNTDSVTGGADFAHNTGELFLSSADEFTFGTTSSAVLQAAGFLNTTVAPDTLDINSAPASYSTHKTGTLGLQDLRINGIAVPAAVDDGLSTVLPEFSAAAKAAAINSVSSQTSVTAEITPPMVYAGDPVEAGTMLPGDLILNGVDIFTDPTGTAIIDQDVDNVIIDRINSLESQTGIVASRDMDGKLILKAIDGRNLQVETSVNGETLTHINGSLPPGIGASVYIGQVQLLSDRTYMLESPVFGPDNLEAGLIALGLDGGQAVTGEPADQIGDGKVSALSIIDQQGTIRYAGDRHSELEIKVSKVNKLAIAQNGQTALMDTRVFNELQNLEDALLGVKYTEVTSLYRADDLTATLDSGNTGFIEDDYEFSTGNFEVTITDHDHQPPQTFTMKIGVDVTTDSLASIADKLNGIPGLNAAWNADKYLEIKTDDPDRYSVHIENDSSHFTDIVNITSLDMQVHALDNSIAAFDLIMENLTTQISDFGARANRITVQTEIFSNLKLATRENLSEKQDTDFIQAVMDLKAKEVAYQAALSSAAKTMQLSLVDYLK